MIHQRSRLIISGAMALSLSACGGGGGGSASVSAPVAVTTAPQAGTEAGTGGDTGTGAGTANGAGTVNTGLSTAFQRFGSGVTVTQSGASMVLQSTTEPDHKSPYFSTADSRYEAYNGANPQFRLNPNRISSQTLRITIPANPAQAAVHQNTGLGPIGMAVNGVPLYNQYAGPNQPLTNEINSFDQYNGHPQMTGQYHYHVEPLALTARNGKGSLIGFLLDGFPVYGPVENGRTLSSADLDSFHGHSHATAEYPNGIYHYHITADSPYINGGQYYGTPGTQSN